MKKRESKLWLRIKNLKLKGQIFRIESNTINGIPDIYYLKNSKSIWIEASRPLAEALETFQVQ
jgi:hypothetical protein